LNLLTLALRNLRRRPTRSIVVTISVGLAIASALTLVALSDSIERGTSEGIDERGADLTVLQRDASDVFSGFIPQAMESRLAAVPGIAATAGELATYAPVEHDRQRLVLGWSDASFFWRRMPIREGRAPKPGERRVVVLGAAAAENLHKRAGEDLDILGARFRIVAIAGYASALNRSVIILPLEDLQEISFKSGQVTVIHLRLDGRLAASDVERIRSEVEKLGRLTAAPTDQLLRNDRNLAVLKAISQAVSLIALTLGALSVLNALLMAVQERTREIGVMMAIGWSRRHTIASIVIEGIVIGIGGSLIGMVLAYAASLSFTSIPQIGNYLSFSPNAAMVLPTLLAAVAMCALGSLYPAWRATLLTPAEAIRGL
jgi:putative ABC transport system permease protein